MAGFISLIYGFTCLLAVTIWGARCLGEASQTSVYRACLREAISSCDGALPGMLEGKALEAQSLLSCKARSVAMVARCHELPFPSEVSQ